MTITAGDVAKLRDMTGAGMMDAKKALTEADGDMEKAIDILRKSGAMKAAKKSDRVTAEGRVHCYTHGTGKLSVMVEVMCETDFVARTSQFQDLCQDLAMHIAAAAPMYRTKDEVPQEVVDREKAIYQEQLAAEGKPAEVTAKIIEGKLAKYFSEICLMDQAFVKDDSMTITQLIDSKVLSIGESLKIGRFVRMQLGA
ncbi:MAG: translation elongation factor Ts [Patescibacteria group bacterium]|jgi:elongation factor Ts